MCSEHGGTIEINMCEESNGKQRGALYLYTEGSDRLIYPRSDCHLHKTTTVGERAFNRGDCAIQADGGPDNSWSDQGRSRYAAGSLGNRVFPD